MRLLLATWFVTLVMLVAGCPGASSELAVAPEQDDGSSPGTGSGPGDGNAPGGIWACDSDDDCVAAGATCCECPTYATGVDDPSVAACGEVECGPSTCTSNVRAACEDNACVLACAPVACSNTCPNGFRRDVNGCLTCECAAARTDQGSCTDDSQCVRVDGDCCGCERGGIDTAVRAGTEQQYRDMLGCTSDPQCPNVDTCVAGDAPHCIQGTCTLAQPLPPGACGRPDLPACDVCTVNANDQADTHGVGICNP